MKTKLLTLILCLALALTCGAAFAEQLDAPDESKTVASLEVYTMPTKTVYVIGDTFSAEGGVIKINYDDGTWALIDMTDPAVQLSQPPMNTANTKNVAAMYMNQRAVFQVEVASAMLDVTFDYNYEGAPEATVVQASEGAPVEEPAAPTRDGYTFVAWYTSPDYVETYDFSAPVEESLTLYAFWTRDDATYVNVTFDYGYYGKALSSYSYPVESGTAVARPSADPTRVGYTFADWVDADGNAYDFAAAVDADTTITATWTKDSEEAQTWVFEAEDTDLTGKIGPSYSGTAQEESMIIFNDAIDASNDRVVGYLYQSGVSLEFPLASDSAVSDVQLVVRITGEYTTMSYDGNDFQVLVNDTPCNYDRITIEADQSGFQPCQDLIVIEGVSLNEGANLIQLKTNNTNAVTGTTFASNAPVVDCIKLTTTAVVTWDENSGVPAANY